MRESLETDPNQALVVVDTLDYNTKLREIFGNKSVLPSDEFYEGLKKVIKFLGDQRMLQEKRVDILNSACLHFGKYWTIGSLSKFAREVGIRMAPVNDSLYAKFQANKAEQHEFLPHILQQVRDGKTTFPEIRQGLATKFGGRLWRSYNTDTDTEDRVPKEAIISRILKFCRHDSPETAQQIDDAFAEGQQKKNPTSTLTAYLRRIQRQAQATPVN